MESTKKVLTIIKRGPAFGAPLTQPKQETWQDLINSEELKEYEAILRAVQHERDVHNYRAFKKQYNKAVELGWI